MHSLMMEQKNLMFEKAAEDNKTATEEILKCLQGAGKRGEKRITLFISETRGNGSDNSGRI